MADPPRPIRIRLRPTAKRAGNAGALDSRAVAERAAARRGTERPIIADRYRLDRRLGDGSSATVYAATDVQLGRPVTLKLFDQAIASDPRLRARFREQAAKAAQLKHPRIAAILDAGIAEDPRDGERPYVVTEPAGSRTLRSLLEAEGRLSLERAIVLARQVAAALCYAHGRGVIHADLKPENVIVDETGSRARLVDFSLSFVYARTGVVTLETMVRRAAYLAPEQVLGDPAGPGADIYGLAVLVYETIAGRPPFVGGTPLATAERRLTEAARPVGSFDPTIPPDLEAVLARALERSPQDRWATVDEFDQGLAGIDTTRRVSLAADDSVGPAAGPARRARPSPPSGRRPIRKVVPVLAAVVALAMALTVFGPLLAGVSGFRVDLGRTSVPNVVGMTVDEAGALAGGRGMAFAVIGERPSDRAPRGVVVQQSPIAGWRLDEEQPLRVTLSAGVTVPDVRGRSVAEVTTALAELGWNVGRVDRARQPGSPSGTIVIQHPAPGEVLASPGELALVVAE